MLSLVLAFTLAAAPAAQPAPGKEAVLQPVLDPAHHDESSHHGHAKEEPLSEQDKAVFALGDTLAGITRENLATYDALLKIVREAREPKDCAPAAKAVAERAKKNDAEQIKRRAEADAARKKMPPGDAQAGAAKALLTIKDDLKGFRERVRDYETSIAAFKGRCPKLGDEVEKSFTALRKRLMQ